MKLANCKHCVNSCKRTYIASCDKYATFSIEDARKEYSQLLVLGQNIERLKQLKDKIDYFDWGII